MMETSYTGKLRADLSEISAFNLTFEESNVREEDTRNAELLSEINAWI
jgi:hypothetical protein